MNNFKLKNTRYLLVSIAALVLFNVTAFAEIRSGNEHPAERKMYKKFGFAGPIDRFYSSYDDENRISNFKAPPPPGRKANPLTRGLSSVIPADVEVTNEKAQEDPPGAPSDAFKDNKMPKRRF